MKNTQIGCVVRGTRTWMQAYEAAQEMLYNLKDGYTIRTAWGYEIYSGKLPGWPR